LAGKPQNAGISHSRRKAAFGELIDAFADLGAFLPLVIGVLAVHAGIVAEGRRTV
jgi:hypothetical protein